MITLPTFVVALDQPEPTEHTIQVRGADQIVAEQHAGRLGIALTDNPLHMTYLWCWAALKREKKFTEDWPAFVRALVGVESIEDAEVDPTQTAPANTSP